MNLAIQQLLFLTREESFVSSEPIGDLPPGKFVRVTAIPTPGFRGLALITVSLFVVYGAFLAFAAWRLGGNPWIDALLPTALVTVNGAVRACFKIRERRAALAKWHKPVGRERTSVRVGFGLIGLIVAGAAGWLLAVAAPGLPSFESKAIAAAGLGLLEGIRNVARIGGKYKEPEFRIEDFQAGVSVGDT